MSTHSAASFLLHSKAHIIFLIVNSNLPDVIIKTFYVRMCFVFRSVRAHLSAQIIWFRISQN